MTLKVLSTFSGVGGLDLEFLKSDEFDIVAYCEADKNCRDVLRYHDPDKEIFEDVNLLDDETTPDHDILIGGFPCTDISFQGAKAGLIKGEKSSLLFKLIEILDSKKPKYFIFENVEALLSKKYSEEFSHAKKEIRKAGYDVYFEVIDSSLHGTPQARRRVFLYGFREDVRRIEDCSIYAPEGLEQSQDKESDYQILAWSKSTRKEHIDFRFRTDGLVNTLTRGKGCNGFSTGNLVYKEGKYRFLNPTECEGLMTWPKNHTKYGMDELGNTREIAESNRYKMIGNGVVSSCTKPIIKLILKNEKV